MDKPKVLVVDDFDLNRKLMRTLFRSWDCIMLEAENAEEGVALALRELPDLIIMDIQLPGMDGLQATARLKSQPRTRHIPVVAVSAYGMDEDKEAAMSAGCDGYLSKPIDSRNFLDTVRVFLPRKS